MGPHSDVYALGAMLYHLLAGHMPFVPWGARLNNYAVWSAVQQGPPPPIQGLAPDAPAELIAICEKAMAREIRGRYRDMSELARDLAAFVEGRVVAAYRTGAWAETKKWVQRNQALAASLAAAGILLAGGLATSLTLGARAERNAVLAAENAARADDKAAEAERLRQEAVVREEAATARADALWAIEELKDFKTLDDDLAHARLQWDRPTCVWWLEKARELVHGRPADPVRGLRKRPGLADHHRLFAEMRKSFVPTKDELAADGPRSQRIDLRRGVPYDREKQWWNTNLGQLEQDLLELEQRIKLAERSVTDPEAVRAWSVALEAIAGSLKYGGLRITPQLELLPLGPDPESGLWEFAHLGTGEPAVRRSDGKLTLEPETGIVFVLLPSGRVPVEDGEMPTPLNEVQLDAFFLSKYEMTVAQWKRTSLANQPRIDAPLLPANGVSWDDCVATIEHAGLFLRLPTETQWEYGCRGGTTTPWWTGTDEGSLPEAANFDYEPNDEWVGDPQAVGSLLANPFGLHDVHGNVWEWCRDAFGDDDVPIHSGEGERKPTGARFRVLRGGGYTNEPALGRSGRRYPMDPEVRRGVDGLRVARTVTP
jgi:formylglycine-generating enzyme required for sulfatase activity